MTTKLTPIELLPGSRDQATICEDCGRSIRSDKSTWTTSGDSYCSSCRPEIARQPQEDMG